MGLEPRLSKYLTVKNIKKQNRLIKHQQATQAIGICRQEEPLSF